MEKGGEKEPPLATIWRDPSTMGTPASITRDLPQNQIAKSCTRKRASANIFQGVGLLQLRRLFRSSGDMQAEERAQLIWERAESQCITRALQQLHRRQRKLKLQANGKPLSGKGSSTRLLELQHFNHLRIEDCDTFTALDGDSKKRQKEIADGSGHYIASQSRKKEKEMDVAMYTMKNDCDLMPMVVAECNQTSLEKPQRENV
ncbi:PREDICTED: arginine vasopressin-induced protein 1 isoform X1 [Thamnophis sirtalis]|uniref:Arginine vasopressin-induced protein 1 n=2 Tax=Thamnophis sirtalis TaxID=35019 RepID=A0A6I9YCX8_9SAUR|nr:PREDICTED: arginine vasopressin-induced protein 1 isoform X1 [Thamnophis sirtalis]